MGARETLKSPPPELALVFDWRGVEPRLVEMRFTHERIDEKQSRGWGKGLVWGGTTIKATQLDGKDLQDGMKALALFLLHVAEQVRRHSAERPADMEGGPDSLCKTLFNGLDGAGKTSVNQPKWIALFGRDRSGDPLAPQCIDKKQAKGRDGKKQYRASLRPEALPAAAIRVCELDAAGKEVEIDNPDRLKALMDEIQGRKEGPGSPHAPAPRRDVLPPKPPYFVGREGDLRAVQRALGVGAEPSAGGAPAVVAVRGWPGVGKTTLATEVAHHTATRARFGRVIWLEVGQFGQPDEGRELLRRLQLLGTELGDDLHEVLKPLDPTRGLTEGDVRSALPFASQRLRRAAQPQSLLLVLDDVWEVGHFEALNVVGGGGALLVTTRVTEVARALEDRRATVHLLPVLSPGDAVRLLEEHAPQAVASDRGGCEELARALECLPLALRVAGCLLRDEAAEDAGRLLTELRQGRHLLAAGVPPELSGLVEQTPSLTVAALLRRSVDGLDRKARWCFAMLSGVRKDRLAQFDLDYLSGIWGSALTPEEARETARLLARRGLLERAGGGSAYQMHALLVMLAESLCPRS